MEAKTKQEIYKMIFYGQVTDAEKILLETKASQCLLALAYTIHNKTEEAEEAWVTCDRNNQDAIEQQAYEEMMMIRALRQTGRESALEQAAKIVETFPNASVANYFLAQSALKRRKWDIALGHYQKIMQIYPDNDGLLLDAARALFFLNKNSDALEHAKRAKASLRQRLYMMLIPLGRPVTRLVVLFAVFLFFVITGLNFYVYMAFMLLMTISFLVSLRKDTLVSANILYMGTFSTAIWLLSWLFDHWVWSLMQGR